MEKRNDISALGLLNTEIFLQNVVASGGGSGGFPPPPCGKWLFCFRRREPFLISILVSIHRSKAHQSATSFVLTSLNSFQKCGLNIGLGSVPRYFLFQVCFTKWFRCLCKALLQLTASPENFAPIRFVRYRQVEGGKAKRRLALQPDGYMHVAAHTSPDSTPCIILFQPQPSLNIRKTCVSLLRNEISQENVKLRWSVDSSNWELCLEHWLRPLCLCFLPIAFKAFCKCLLI